MTTYRIEQYAEDLQSLITSTDISDPKIAFAVARDLIERGERIFIRLIP